MDAVGASEDRTAYEIERVNPEVQDGNQESEVQPAGHGEPEEVVDCPCHEPVTFVKGKPRSILGLLELVQCIGSYRKREKY